MKAFKKTLALILALVMVLGMSVTAFADETPSDDGSITVRNATVGEEYNAYKVFDLTYENIPAVPGNPEAEPPVPAVPEKNLVAYSYTKASGTDALFDALTIDDSPFTLTRVGSTDTYTVTVKSGVGDDAIIAFVEDLYDDGLLTAVGAPVKATSDTVSFNDLPYGYYVVETTLGEAALTIDSTLKDVTVIDKNELPSWDNNPEDPDDPNPPTGETNPGKVILVKDDKGAVVDRVTENSVNYGDTVDFSIAINAKAYVGEDLATYYYITDTLGEGFGAYNGDVTVKVIPAVAGKDGKMVYDPDSAITLGKTEGDFTAHTYSIDYSNDDHTFVITVPFGEQYGANAKIEVTYSATVLSTDDVVLGPDGNPNTANFTYDVDEDFDPDDDPENPKDPENPPYDPTDPEDLKYPEDKPKDPSDPTDPDDPGDFPPETKVETTTYVYGIDVIKIDGEDKAPLAGAKFELYVADCTVDETSGEKDYGDEEDWELVKFAADTDVTTKPSYDYNTAGGVTEFTTADDGTIYLKGLQELPEGKTYLLVETEAPKGYNQITEPIEVTVSKVASTEDYESSTSTEGDPVTYKLVPEMVLNNSGVELPSTGGIGTTIFYILGAILLIGAGVLLVTKKRMGNEA